MKYAIIAAGNGSRLASEGISIPKPLVSICGEPLIDRLIRIFMKNDAEDISVICNKSQPQVADHLSKIQEDGLNGMSIPLHFIVKSTPSSMHSFRELCSRNLTEPFILTTVDTVFREDEFAEYVKAFETSNADALMGVTAHVDDEMPLWVKIDKNNNVKGFYDESEECTLVSGGIYGLKPQSIFTLHNCIARGEKRMRSFQRALIAEGQHVCAWQFSKVFDIDHIEDIWKAEEFLIGR